MIRWTDIIYDMATEKHEINKKKKQNVFKFVKEATTYKWKKQNYVKNCYLAEKHEGCFIGDPFWDHWGVHGTVTMMIHNVLRRVQRWK